MYSNNEQEPLEEIVQPSYEPLEYCELQSGETRVEPLLEDTSAFLDNQLPIVPLTVNSTGSINTPDNQTKSAPLSLDKVLSTKAWTEKYLCEIDDEWNRWAGGNNTLYVPPVVGSIAAALLKKISGQIATKFLMSIYEKLFPTPDPATMEEILTAVEAMLNQKLSEEVHTRITLELQGLQQNVANFLEDVEDFDNLIILDGVEDGNQPQAIIDSVNTLHQLFVNRMPQFQNPTYKVLLLPLFAQAANLHIAFLKEVLDNASNWGLTSAQVKTYTNRFLDAIRDYSNHCIETYQRDFQQQFSKNFKAVLEYRTFMILNVLEYVSLWPMLRFTNLVIKTSSHLYEYGGRPVNSISTVPYSSWANFNRIFQGFPNRELDSVAANVRIAWERNSYFYGESVLSGNVKSNYTGGKSIQVGNYRVDDCYSNSSSRYCEQRTDIISNIRNLNLNRALVNKYSYSNITPPTGAVLAYQNARFGNDTNEYALVPSQHGNWVSYPDYKIRNIIGFAGFMQPLATNLIDGPENQYRPTQKGELETIITSFQRRDRDVYISYNGGIRHTVHLEYGFDGVTISPLEYFSTYNINRNKNSKFVSLERHGNNGDGIIIPPPEGYIHHGFIYELFNPYPYDYKVDIYLKFAAPQQTRIGLYL
ncbi:insecticidal delta-endotoxin Cry8Ea1 family protein, partial [Bacillus thuringiensis]